MDWREIQQRDLTFLEREKQTLQRRIKQQNNGRHTLHRNGLDGCCAAEWDLDVLESIMAGQSRADALSLESAIMCRVSDLENRIANLQWRREEPSPAAYWRVECQRDFLADLLSRYHAYRRDERSAK